MKKTAKPLIGFDMMDLEVWLATLNKQHQFDISKYFVVTACTPQIFAQQLDYEKYVVALG